MSPKSSDDRETRQQSAHPPIFAAGDAHASDAVPQLDPAREPVQEPFELLHHPPAQVPPPPPPLARQQMRNIGPAAVASGAGRDTQSPRRETTGDCIREEP